MGDERAFQDQNVRLTDLVDEMGNLVNARFARCRIAGPAVIILNESILVGCRLGGPSTDAVLWPIPAERVVVVGAMVVTSCHFEDCTFFNVGIAGAQDFIQSLTAK
jgi:hypothetical protein